MINKIVQLIDEKCEGYRVNEPMRSELLKRNTLLEAADCIPQMSNVPYDVLARNILYG